MKKSTTQLWIMLSLTLVFILSACSSETPVVEQPIATDSSVEAAPNAEPESLPENDPEEDAPEISQPIARWNSVSEKGNWVLVGYGDSLNPVVVEPGTYVTINFSDSDDQVNGSGGCNNFITTYSADDEYNLTINGPVGSTMMACEVGMEQEAMFLSALETTTGYNQTEDGYLLLDYDSGTVYDEQLVFISETALAETVWVLKAYGDPNNLTLSEPGVVTTAVFSTDGNLNGNTGCNNYTASYEIQENQISFGLPATNLMACEKGMEQEQAFMQLLETAQNYRLGVKALEITSADGTKVMRFSAAHLPLENVRWQLAAIDGEILPEGVSAHVLFTPADSPVAQSEENAVNGNAGCNTFFGSYTLAGDTLEAPGPFGLTQMMCEDAAMQVEQAFLAGLESAQSYEITLNQLIINSTTGSLLLYADRLPLEGSKWILTGQGPLDNPQPPIEGAVFTAVFSRQFGMPSGVKSGGTGCNDYISTYFATADEIKVNLPQTSQYACSDGQMEAEQGYFLNLNAARDYRILGNEMQVFVDGSVLFFVGSVLDEEIQPTPTATPQTTGTPTATATPQNTPTPTDEAIPTPTATGAPPEPTATEEAPEPTDEPGADLRDTTWVLEGYRADIEDDELTDSIAGATVNLIFREGGIFDGNTGCNAFSGRYVTDGTNIALQGITATQTNCDQPPGIMDQEAVFLGLLDQAEEYHINQDGELEIIRYVIENDQRVEKIILLFSD